MRSRMKIRVLELADETEVIALWKSTGLPVPRNDSAKDIARKMMHSPKQFLIGLIDRKVVATVMYGYGRHRSSVNYLAAPPQCQGHRLARTLMSQAKAQLRAQGCPKLNLMVRQSNPQAADYYKRKRYAEASVVAMGKRFIQDA